MTKLVTLVAADSRVVLAPEIGGSVASWTQGDRPIMRPLADGTLAENLPRSLASYPLFPFSGRVANRQFSFDGTTYELPALLNGHAIHGCGWQEIWQIADADKRSATMRLDHQPNALWPFAFVATQRFTLSADRLVVDVMIENRHDRPAPAGFGLHPFFPRSPAATLQLHTDHVWPNGPDAIPTAKVTPPAKWDFSNALPVGADFVDNCFGGWDGRACLTYPDLGYRVRIEADKELGHVVVFVPDGQSFFCVEPVSHMPDALNRLTTEPTQGMVVLGRNQRLTSQARFIIENL